MFDKLAQQAWSRYLESCLIKCLLVSAQKSLLLITRWCRVKVQNFSRCITWINPHSLEADRQGLLAVSDAHVYKGNSRDVFSNKLNFQVARGWCWKVFISQGHTMNRLLHRSTAIFMEEIWPLHYCYFFFISWESKEAGSSFIRHLWHSEYVYVFQRVHLRFRRTMTMLLVKMFGETL